MSLLMEFEWDETKRRSNLEKYGLDFGDLDEFSWAEALFEPSARRDYDEDRFVAVGDFRGEFYAVILTWRSGKTRIISFRKARPQEVKRYEAQEEVRSSKL
jgi:uncharacterized DUF497 family protein